MSRINQRRSSKEQFWRNLLREWHSSGLSVRAFCKEHGLAEPAFYAWRRVVAQRDAAEVRFVPVQVVPEPKLQATAGSIGVLELVLDAGRVLRVGPGFDGPTLKRLLALLEEGQP